MLHCALSGEVPAEPVASPKSGGVFERRTIEKHIEQFGTDPISKAPLAKEELIALALRQPVVRPRPPAAASVPALLSTLQNEWDALMVETYSLKEQLHLARQQLAQALYRNDAASRVIARLIKERDAARQQLAGGARVAESKSAAQMVDDEEQQQQQAGDLEAVFSRKMEAAYAALSGDRGKRVKELKKAAAPAETLLKFALLGAHAPVRGAGIVHVELLNKELAVVGCADGRVALVDLTSGTARQEVEGHRGAVKSLCASSDVATLVTVGADRALIVWHRTPEGLAVTRRLAERGEPVCVAAHPCAEFAVVAFKDARWSLLHLPSGRVIRTTVDEGAAGSFTCVAVHPDGNLLALGTDAGVVRVYDFRRNATLAALAQGHRGAVTHLSFSENGFALAVADAEGGVHLWDLSGPKVLHSLAPAGPVRGLAFDSSGLYLAVAGRGVRLFLCKTAQPLGTLGGEAEQCNDARFVANAAAVIVARQDGQLAVFGAPPQ